MACCDYNLRGIKDCQEPPESRRHSSLEPQMWAWPCQHFGCGLLASGTETTHFCCLKPSRLREFAKATLGNQYNFLILITNLFTARLEASPRRPCCPWSLSQCNLCDLKSWEASSQKAPCPGQCIFLGRPCHYNVLTYIFAPLNFNQWPPQGRCFDYAAVF